MITLRKKLDVIVEAGRMFGTNDKMQRILRINQKANKTSSQKGEFAFLFIKFGRERYFKNLLDK